MAVIALEGMHFRAFHGLYEEERIIGNDFILDIEIKVDVSKVVVIHEHGIDKIDNTINYETVYEICKIEMATPHKLLEQLLTSILLALKFQFKTMFSVKIKIKKLNPPMGGRVEWSSLEDFHDFIKQCGRCEKPLICYDPLTNSCGCIEVIQKIHPRTLEMLKTQFKGCLCRKCYEEFAG